MAGPMAARSTSSSRSGLAATRWSVIASVEDGTPTNDATTVRMSGSDIAHDLRVAKLDTHAEPPGGLQPAVNRGEPDALALHVGQLALQGRDAQAVSDALAPVVQPPRVVEAARTGAAEQRAEDRHVQEA